MEMNVSNKCVWNSRIFEVNFPKENFLKITETLTRVGKKLNGKTLQQVVFLLHKKDKFFIVHQHQLEMLDGKEEVDFSEEDFIDTQAIVSLLFNWGLLSVVNDLPLLSREASIKDIIKIVPFREKHRWTLVSMYDIGSYIKGDESK